MYLKYVLLEQKIIESEVEIDELLEDIDSDSTLIQSLIFDKDVFETKEEVLDWVKSHGFYVEKEIDETSDAYRVRQVDPSEFYPDSFRTIEIRKGIKAVIGKIREIELEEPCLLSLRNDDSIKFNEELPSIIELARVVRGFHKAYGEVEITKEHLQSFVKNFNDKVTGIDISIDYDHNVKEAAGWLQSVFLSYDNKTLYGQVKWTPKGAKCLSDREFRYFSPEFTLNFVHPHTGTSYGATLLGGGLVNRPFLKMDAIVSMKEDTNNKNEVNIMSTISLKDHEAKIEEKDAAIEELKLSEEAAKKTIGGLKEENTKLSERVKVLEEEKVKKEREDRNAKLFNDGKINKAQLDALNEGKDFYEVLSLSEKMHTEPTGKDGENNDVVMLSEKEKELCDSFGLTPEEFIKFNKED